MEQLATFRFFCSHNCFEVSDATVEPWNEPSELDGLTPEDQMARLQRGWYRKGRAVVFRTLVQTYDNKITFFRAASHQVPPDADRVLAVNLSLPSGTVMIFGLDCGETVSVGPGDYVVFCRAYKLGVESPWDAPEMADDEFLKRDDLERFELVLVPGSTDREGVIGGAPALGPTGQG